MAYVGQSGFSTRHALAIGVIALVHVGFVYALQNGMGRGGYGSVPRPIQIEIVAEDVLPPKELPPPPFKIDSPQPFVPMPEVQIDLPRAPQTIGAVSSFVSSPPLPPAVEPRQIVKTQLLLDRRRSPSSENYYPPLSKRTGEQGSAVVEVCVGPDGRVYGQAKLLTPSPHPRLNAAALEYAINTRWFAATEDGKKVQACTPLSVRFVLEER